MGRYLKKGIDSEAMNYISLILLLIHQKKKIDKMYSSNSTIFGINSVGTHCLCLIYYWDILKLMIMIKNPILLLLLRISRCPQCKWPLCCSECRGLYTATGHSTTECTLLSRVNTQDFEYEPITPLRCVLLQTVDSAKWTLFNR